VRQVSFTLQKRKYRNKMTVVVVSTRGTQQPNQ